MANDLGLQISGIDFLCADIEDPDADYRVIEINSAPNLENYAPMGETQTNITHDLYQAIFNERDLDYSKLMRGLKGKYYGEL